MNLNSIVSSAIGAINPPVPLSVQISTGTTQDASFKQVPTYAMPVTVMGQVQPLTWRDIQQLDGLNLQGTRRKIYISAHIDGLVRVDNKGGDLITDNCGNTWLVAMVLEAWPSWTSCAATLQDGS